jgi:hypothetical protein
MDEVDTVKLARFPGLTFVEGRCAMEHGDTAVAQVAVDDGGQTFLLDSPSSFAYMVRLHPPAPVDSANAVAYALDALRMTGKLATSDTLVTNVALIPESVASGIGLDRKQVSKASRVLQRLNHGYRVQVITMGKHAIKANEILVYSTGLVELIGGRVWDF